MIASGRRLSNAGSDGGKPVNGLSIPGSEDGGIYTPGGTFSGRITTLIGAGGMAVSVGGVDGVGAESENGESEAMSVCG